MFTHSSLRITHSSPSFSLIFTRLCLILTHVSLTFAACFVSQPTAVDKMAAGMGQVFPETILIWLLVAFVAGWCNFNRKFANCD